MQPQSLRSFFKRRIAIALIVFSVCALVFVYAMQITSVLVCSDEAMRARVQYAIGTDPASQSNNYMSRFFAPEYLNTGELQKLQAAYQGINVTSYMQLASTQWIWTWPWGGTAYVKVHDKIGSIAGDVLDEDNTKGIPAWPNGLYALTLEKRNGAWVVVSMKLISLDPAEPTATPSVTPTIQPSPTATPKATKK